MLAGQVMVSVGGGAPTSQCLAVPKIGSPNTALVHGVPSDRVLTTNVLFAP